MIIQRYIYKELIITFCAITGLLLTIFMVFAYLHFLHEAAEGGIPRDIVFAVLPSEIFILLPVVLPASFYLSVLLTFYKFNNNNEIQAMVVCGISKLQLLLIVLMIIPLVIVVVVINMLWFYPAAFQQQSDLRMNAIYETSIEKIPKDSFKTLGGYGNFYQDKSVFFTMPYQNNSDIIISATVKEIATPNVGKILLFNNGYHYIGNPGSSEWQVIKFQKYGILLFKQQFQEWLGSLSLLELFIRINKDPYAAAELHWRLAAPISVFTLTLLGLVLIGFNSRSIMIPMLFSAILIYLVYLSMVFIGLGWIRIGIVGYKMGLWWAHGIILGLGLYFLILHCVIKKTH